MKSTEFIFLYYSILCEFRMSVLFKYILYVRFYDYYYTVQQTHISRMVVYSFFHSFTVLYQVQCNIIFRILNKCLYTIIKSISGDVLMAGPLCTTRDQRDVSFDCT